MKGKLRGSINVKLVNYLNINILSLYISYYPDTMKGGVRNAFIRYNNNGLISTTNIKYLDNYYTIQ